MKTAVILITTLLACRVCNSQEAAPLARRVSEEAKVYQAVRAGVVAVECDFGSGSGFVVDPRGLILTNQHVTNGTHWAAIRFDRGLRFPAEVVEKTNRRMSRS